MNRSCPSRWALALPLFLLLICASCRAAVVYVNTNAAGAVHDGANWANAFPTVQAGINAGKGGDEVWVAAGTYKQAITLKPGVKLYGGFTGTESARSQRNIAANVTILGTTDQSAWVPDSVVTAPAGCGRDTVLSGFTISRGSGKSTGSRFYGGGVYCDNSSPTIEFDTIVGNFTWSQMIGRDWIGGGSGGGIACYNGAAPLFTGNVIARNSAQFALIGGDGGLGAGVYCNNSSPTLVNNIIVSNSGSSGSGIIGEGTSSPTLVNNIIAFNDGGVSLPAGTLRNNDVFSNSTDYSGIADPTGTNGNIKADPKLASIRGIYDYHIEPNSPCVDAGDDSVITPGTTDLDGRPRISEPHVDIGAYESAGIQYPTLPSVTYVAPNGDDNNSGRSWTDAKATISSAINATAFGGEVWVSAGAYVQDFVTSYNVSVYGGFAGIETLRSQRNAAMNVTTLIQTADGGVSIDGASVFDGFRLVLQAGTAYQPTAISAGGTAAVTNNVVGSGFTYGIAVYGSPLISGNVITGATVCGISYTSQNGSERPIIARNVVSGCGPASYSAGGGISCLGSTDPPNVTVHDNLIAGNRGPYGGGVYSNLVTLSLVNNTIVGNTATGTTSGGGVYSKSGSVTMINNIIAFNSSGLNLASATFDHNDVFGNVAFDYGGAVADPTGTSGNIKADPLFANKANGDYHLQSGSPCVNAGDDSVVSPGDVDINGNPRKLGSHVDMGAYEFLVPSYFTIADAATALRLAGGLGGSSPSVYTRLNVVADSPATGVVDLRDAIRIARKAAGLDANP